MRNWLAMVFPLVLLLAATGRASGGSSAVEAAPESRAVSDERGIYIVLDGLGGHASPGTAATVAVETSQASLASEKKASKVALQAALAAAGDAIFKRAQADTSLKGMGATGAALWISGKKAYVAHVGDVRVYVFRGGKLTQLTKDHSLLNDYLKTHPLTKQEIEDFPMKNVVIRALGMKASVEVDAAEHPVKAKDLWLVTSAALTRRLDDAQLAKILAGAKGKADDATAALSDAASKATSTSKSSPAFVVVAVP
ncbi:MAG: serine/threonine-protein phosphatase [Kofleriaceae bacterium]|nr:serine/threonine-protein phosphatase [Kofleriaceae bacterium]